jgi:hypothetical protein
VDADAIRALPRVQPERAVATRAKPRTSTCTATSPSSTAHPSPRSTPTKAPAASACSSTTARLRRQPRPTPPRPGVHPARPGRHRRADDWLTPATPSTPRKSTGCAPAGGGTVTETSVIRHNRIIEGSATGHALRRSRSRPGRATNGSTRSTEATTTGSTPPPRSRAPARILERLRTVREAIDAERPDDPEAVIHTTLFDPAARTITETWRLLDTEYRAPWGGPGFVAFEVTTRHGERAYQHSGRVRTGNYPDVTPDADVHLPHRDRPGAAYAASRSPRRAPPWCGELRRAARALVGTRHRHDPRTQRPAGHIPAGRAALAARCRRPLVTCNCHSLVSDPRRTPWHTPSPSSSSR